MQRIGWMNVEDLMEARAEGIERQAGNRGKGSGSSGSKTAEPLQRLSRGKINEVKDIFLGSSRASREMELPRGTRSRIESRMGVSLEGLRAFEDTALRQDGFKGYAQGNEIHIDSALKGAEREHIIEHEVGHVVQRGSGLAQGSGFLNDAALEAQADTGFSAPANFTMPATATGPVMGAAGDEDITYEKDLDAFDEWCKNNEDKFNEHADLFNKANHKYDSVTRSKGSKDGKVGSIYFGNGQGGQGGRFRLIHKSGPELRHYDSVTRYAPPSHVVGDVRGYIAMKRAEFEAKHSKDLKHKILPKPDAKNKNSNAYKQYKANKLAWKRKETREHRDQRLQETYKGYHSEDKKSRKAMKKEHPHSWKRQKETLEQRNKRIGKIVDKKGDKKERMKAEDDLKVDVLNQMANSRYSTINPDALAAAEGAVFEIMYNDGEKAGTHESRGYAQKAVDKAGSWNDDPYLRLRKAVQYAEELSNDGNNGQRGNNFLYVFMKKDPVLQTVPLNIDDLKGIQGYDSAIDTLITNKTIKTTAAT
jgi:hypothetical protein